MKSTLEVDLTKREEGTNFLKGKKKTFKPGKRRKGQGGRNSGRKREVSLVVLSQREPSNHNSIREKGRRRGYESSPMKPRRKKQNVRKKKEGYHPDLKGEGGQTYGGIHEGNPFSY